MGKTNTVSKASSWAFLALTLLFTWAFWIPAGLLCVERSGLLIHAFYYVGGLMPPILALYSIYRYKDTAERIDYWRRLIDFKRIGKGWYAVIFLTVPGLTFLGVILGGKGVGLETVENFAKNPLAFIPFSVFILLFGPLPEEMAWRGYALDGLQSRMNALGASLVLGIAWTVWHLPLFYIAGSYQQGLGVGTAQFWLYMLDKIPQSILMTWIYNNNRRSTLSAVLFHFMINWVGELLDLPLQAEIFYILAWWLMAVLVIIVWKPHTLVRKTKCV